MCLFIGLVEMAMAQQKLRTNMDNLQDFNPTIGQQALLPAKAYTFRLRNFLLQ